MRKGQLLVSFAALFAAVKGGLRVVDNREMSRRERVLSLKIGSGIRCCNSGVVVECRLLLW